MKLVYRVERWGGGGGVGLEERGSGNFFWGDRNVLCFDCGGYMNGCIY